MNKEELLAEIERRIEKQEPNIADEDHAAFWIAEELWELLEMIKREYTQP